MMYLSPFYYILSRTLTVQRALLTPCTSDFTQRECDIDHCLIGMLVDTGSIGILACSPELLLGGHELNRALMYVNDLGDEPFEFEGVDDDVITSCYLRTQGVPSRTLELCTSR